MKRCVLLMACQVALVYASLAQDTLVKRSGEELAVKVLRITPNEVEYKRFDNLEGPLIVTLKSQVELIRYANGTKDEFPLPPSVVESANFPVNAMPGIPSRPYDGYPPIGRSRLNNADLFIRGQQDARLYYKGRGAMWGTAVPTFLYFPIGLPIGLAIAATKPRPSNFTTPNPELLREPLYVKGYQQQAHRRKIGKAAAGVGIAAGAWVVLGLVILGSL